MMETGRHPSAIAGPFPERIKQRRTASFFGKASRTSAPPHPRCNSATGLTSMHNRHPRIPLSRWHAMSCNVQNQSAYGPEGPRSGRTPAGIGGHPPPFALLQRRNMVRTPLMAAFCDPIPASAPAKQRISASFDRIIRKDCTDDSTEPVAICNSCWQMIQLIPIVSQPRSSNLLRRRRRRGLTPAYNLRTLGGVRTTAVPWTRAPGRETGPQSQGGLERVSPAASGMRACHGT